MPLPRQTDPKTRSASFDRAGVNVEDRTIAMSVSSDSADILRYISGKGVGYERLMHNSPSNVDLSRFPQDKGGPLLLSHDRKEYVGRFHVTEVSGGVLRGFAKFGNSARAQEAFQDVIDGVLCDTSISYSYDDSDVQVDLTAPSRDYPTYNINRWVIEEASLVSVPADIRTGVGRAEVEIEITTETEPETETEAPETADCKNPSCTEEDPCAECTAEKRKCADRSLPTTTTGPTGPITGGIMPETTGTVNQSIEILQLRQIAENLGKGREASEILSAKPLEEARGLINALLATAPAASVPSMDMSAREAQDYSYARAIANTVDRMEGKKVANSFEDEVALTLERLLPTNYKRQGILVPLQLRAGLDSNTATAGKEAVYTTYGGELIELLTNATMAIQMGATVYSGLQGPLSFPKLTGDATAKWVAENPGVDLTADAPSFGSVGLAPKTLAGATPFSRSLMAQSVFSVEAEVRASLARAHALAIDKAILHGTGANNQPLGIYRQSGVNTVAFGGVPTYSLLQDMLTAAATSNALIGRLGFLTTPGIAGKMAKTLESSVAGASWLWQGQRELGTVCGYKAASTNQVSKLMNSLVDTGGTEHGIIYGNWADTMVGLWGGLDLLPDPYTLKKQQMIEVASFQQADVAVRHPESFCVSTGATIA